jgi:hypothetical protein
MMQNPTLAFPLMASIRMLVSQSGNCSYCIDMNAGILINMAGAGRGDACRLQEQPPDLQ